MNHVQFLIRNLRYHWRGNLAVLLGSAVGAAVLTGALLVGDSLRGSLRQRTERQLGDVDCVLVGTRFLRSDLADQLPGQVRGALLLQGSVNAGAPRGDRQAGQISVWGVNRHFGIDRPELDENEPVAILSANLAKSLSAKVGDTVYVDVQKASVMPRSSLLSRRGIADTTRRIRLTVADILADSDPANALSLSISPTLPSNMFIPIARLQREIEQVGKINALLATGQSAQSLQSALAERLTLDDWGLQVLVPSRKSYISVESSRLLLESTFVEAVESTAQDFDLRSAKTFVYLANAIAHGQDAIPYSVVAALDPAQAAPLGPFLPQGVSELRPGEIVLTDWKDSPLLSLASAKRDAESITLRYFQPEIEGRIQETEHTFQLAGFIKLAGPADDRNLTPPFPGITDRATVRKWDPPFPFEQSRVHDADEAYWQKYRATPKAYIRLDDGQRLWATRFGNVTSIRIAPSDGKKLEATRDLFADALLKKLDPIGGGLTFQPIRERMLEAGQGSTDFGMLFLSFSFFLIVAALMLVGLLYRLNIDRRAAEIGLLRASGFPLRSIRRLLMWEGLLLAIVGSIFGLGGAVLYADAMIRLLVELWPTPGVETFLALHVTLMSLGIGFFSAVLMSALAIRWALRSLSKTAPSQLLKGDTNSATDGAQLLTSSRWPRRIAVGSFVAAIGLGLAAPSMPPGEAQAGTFFGSGALLLTAGLCLIWAWLKRSRHHLVNGRGVRALANLGSRNAGRNPTRSLLTTALLASAAFLLVAVESFRREPDKDFLAKNGGSGGFCLLAQSSTPIDFDLNDEDGREQLEDGLKRHYQDLGLTADERKRKAAEDMALMQGVRFERFRVQGGDDASCLNLYQASRPRLLGVPQSIVDRGGFSFSTTAADADNPWKQLVMPNEPGEAIPCIVEQNTATWMLKKGLGDTFEVPDEENRPLKLRIVALLQDSVFQSEVLVPYEAFRHDFPHTEGFSYFLVEAATDKADAVARVLTDGLSRYGFKTTRARDQVATYLAVQNTYLTTFQLLGGFGLLLGVLGLSVVLLRSIQERRAELALLRSLGYRVRALNGMVLAENVLLLVLGLAAGIVAALAAIAPHMASGGQVPWVRLSALLGAVVAVGLSVAFIAIVTTLRAPLIPALRKE
jgi:putative ABC transport system permease protein